jgi:hypothetical protein
MMKNSQGELDQRRLDVALCDTLSGIERPFLSDDFEATLERWLRREVKAGRDRSAQRTMRVYWFLSAVASLLVLLFIGSPSPMITWTVVGSLVMALLLGAAPQFLFGRPQRRSLLDLILTSVRS